jgi:hypothetical protein
MRGILIRRAGATAVPPVEEVRGGLGVWVIAGGSEIT